MLTEEQKNCPYCHPGSNLPPHNAWDDGELQFEELDDPKVDNSGDCWGDIGFAPAEKILTSWGEGEEPLVININYCPMCGRPLGGNEDEHIS